MGLARVLLGSAALALTLSVLAPSTAESSGARPASAQGFAREAAELRRQSSALAVETEALGAAATAQARAQVLRQEALARAQASVAEAEVALAHALDAASTDRAALESLIIQAWFARASDAAQGAQAALRAAAAQTATQSGPQRESARLAEETAARRRAAATVLASQAAAGELRLSDVSLRLNARSEDHAAILERLALAETRARSLRRDPDAAGQAAPRLAAALFGPGGARTVLGAAEDRPGVIYAGSPGQLVAAPEQGRISFSGPLRGYGQVLILELDSGYAIVFAGLDRIRGAVGDTVENGAVIGSFSSPAAVAPELYVEVRRSSRPVDPERAARSWTVAAIDAGISGARP